ncbi:septum formation inhibitor Maf [Gilvibacter sediminis]|uniref:septum formation inhibitor Maf n=1 Tax=Gilvibacter sediminis TaxID=379071 RepID=UPI00235053EA|nr:septum formation inhibitor Maf [Gilvibacter sediminis]MDC7999079.1 septum formation inhibitor Maf [Gilvibacter sediminis]
MRNLFTILFLMLTVISCKETTEIGAVSPQESSANDFKYTPSQQHKDYWFNGTAEISSYALSQARYGELREGQAAMIFVTEPFSKSSFTKADNPTAADPSVLKLNFTKNFNTGIYPYSMINSSFFPFEDGQHSLKIATSVQEWCGHVYMELKNTDQFEIDINSYFQGEGQEGLRLSKSLLEDDLWSMIRLQNDNLPQGDLEMIPSFFYLRLKHVKAQAYKAVAELSSADSISSYTLKYPELKRTIKIDFQTAFPHKILGWEESHPKGFGSSDTITTTGTLIKSIRSDYWRRNSNSDSVLRDTLGLK